MSHFLLHRRILRRERAAVNEIPIIIASHRHLEPRGHNSRAERLFYVSSESITKPAWGWHSSFSSFTGVSGQRGGRCFTVTIYHSRRWCFSRCFSPNVAEQLLRAKQKLKNIKWTIRSYADAQHHKQNKQRQQRVITLPTGEIYVCTCTHTHIHAQTRLISRNWFTEIKTSRDNT